MIEPWIMYREPWLAGSAGLERWVRLAGHMATVRELQAELQRHGLATAGKKSELQARLAQQVAQQQQEEESDWEQPPPGVDGEPLRVDFRINISTVDDVRTKESDAFIKMGVVFYWTDPRLERWTAGGDHGRRLPPKLWGPTLVLGNGKDVTCEHFDFSLVKPWEGTGRLKRVINWSGTIANPMSLRNFPFDIDDVAVNFYSNSHYVTLDFEESNGLSSGRSYHLHPIRGLDPAAEEGSWLSLFWDGEMHEWLLHGISTRVVAHPPKSRGSLEQTEVFLSFHLSRKSGFFFWKALLPLYLTVLLASAMFHFPVADLEGRTNVVAT